MLKGIIGTIFIIGMQLSLYSQEICNNAIDDDGDGLIDLNDPDCQCGAGLNAQWSSAIPNPNFDNSSCCPDSYYYNNNNNLNCLDDWSTANTVYNNWSLNYQNSCDSCDNYYYNNTYYNIPQQCTLAVPNGFLAMGFYNYNYNNNYYNQGANACLNAPFMPGNTYTLAFDAFNNWGNYNWNGTWNQQIHFSLMGTADCNNIPIQNQNCADPDWYLLDSISPTVPFDSAWHTFSFTFSPSVPTYGIALAQTCFTVTNPGTTYNWNRIMFDSLDLMYSKLYNIQIADTGSFCTNDYLLTASIDTTGGTWQWYQDSIALIGETNDVIDITPYGLGNFTALYTLSDNCQGLNFEAIPSVYPYAFLNSGGNGCLGDSITFDASSFVIGGYTIAQHYWDFGNGDSAFVEDPTYAYDTSGTFYVKFTAETNLGCQTSDSLIVNIYDKPTVAFITNENCFTDSVNFESMSTVGLGSYIDSLHWKFGDNTVAFDSLESHLYLNPGTYNVTLFAASELGCSDSLIKQITIDPNPTASFTVNDTCVNDAISISNSSNITSGSIQTYSWDFGDNTTGNTQQPSHVYNQIGTYLIELIVVSDSGCTDTAYLNHISHPNPIADFSTVTNCFVADFTSNSSIVSGNIQNHAWIFGDNQSSTEINPTNIYQVNNTYNVSLKVTSNFGCTHELTKPVVIYSNFAADINTVPLTICSGDCIQFFDRATAHGNDASYVWKLSDGQTSKQQNPSFCFRNDNENALPISVFFKLETSAGCVDSILMSDYFNVIANPTAYFTFSPELPPLQDPEVQFKNQSQKASNFDWNFGDNTGSFEEDPNHTYPGFAKNYTVILTVSDATSTCFDTYESLLIIKDEILYFIPNAFSPGSGNINNFFQPQFTSGVNIYQFRMQIFNRWGELVFESYDPAAGWDGLYNFELVEQDTYVWKIDFIESMSDKKHSDTGVVTVVR